MLDVERIREKITEETRQQASSGVQVREVRRTRTEAIFSCSEKSVRRNVRIDTKGIFCDCTRDDCVHIAAALAEAASCGALQEIEKTCSRENGALLQEMTTHILPETEEIALELTLALQGGRLKAGLRSGIDRLYVVRSIPLLIEAMEKEEPYVFGKGFEFDPRYMRFDPEMGDVLEILADLCENAGFSTGAEARLLPLSPRGAVRLLGALSNTPFRLMTEQNVYQLQGIEKESMPLNTVLSMSGDSLLFSAHYPFPFLPLTQDRQFIFADGKVWHIEESRRPLCDLLYERGSKGLFTASFSAQDPSPVLRDILPWLTGAGNVSIDPGLSDKLIRVPLKRSVYLDRAGRDVTARVTFTYGEIEIDPFQPENKAETGLLLRDAEEERAVLDELAHCAFRVRRGSAYLHGSEKIYDFLSDGVNHLTQIAEVYLSNEFKLMHPKKVILQGALSVSGGKLHLDMLEGQTPIEELLPLMEAIRARKRYFRFREGSFIELNDTEKWVDFAEAVIQSVNIDTQEMELYRAAYFDALIRQADLPVQESSEVKKYAALKCSKKEPPLDCLRSYQKRGFEWLSALYELGMGGILADEMGLGKTVQTLAALTYVKTHEKEELPSLIISPTSLTYNWLSEIEHFVPDMRAVIIEGNQQARAKQMKEIELGEYDIVITSYPLIRRDIDRMASIPFRFVVLDEAQNIKNIRSVGARAVKRLDAKCRLALTGTPMENHPGELWSLYDFVLPGYLPSYPDFLRRYAEGANSQDLLARTRPFMMRRLKKDVLKDLPPLMESVQLAYMPAQQRRAYDAALEESRRRIRQLTEAGHGRSEGMEILSVLTMLRQMCCHPGLCLPEYRGGSGKTDMLMDLLSSALSAGHRVLVFSQFTSMLHLIGQRLNEEKTQYFYLDGNTPPEERLQLCERFNGGEKNIFLVSLKAGGTGLNLTGADLVIHYDPWWNPAAEDQATGRAHRIGQKRTVEVIRLIMHDSVEEQVLNMSTDKRQLFEKLVTPGESLPSAMTREDILSLFN